LRVGVAVATFISAIATLALAAGPASAHEVRKVGANEITVGWQHEPTYTGIENAVQIFIKDAKGNPFDDLADPPSLKGQVIPGSPGSEDPRRHRHHPRHHRDRRRRAPRWGWADGRHRGAKASNCIGTCRREPASGQRSSPSRSHPSPSSRWRRVRPRTPYGCP